MNIEITKNHDLGINCYNLLKSNVNYFEDTSKIKRFVCQSFYVEYNHKKIMVDRLKYIMRGNILNHAQRHVNEYEDIANQSEVMLNKFIKLLLFT
ncbi:hypothetical protein [Clostridium beijerinckii]|uniref:hypothetical protein n=1 Tax=Clostridium beijerinckii TaxID=1520 RepID=UPI0022E6525D|nr:hypothetical protein [Clostridium beijerinckii]